MNDVVPALIITGIGILVGLSGWFTLADPNRAALILRNSAAVRDAAQQPKPELFVRRARILGWAAVGAGILLFLLGAIDAIRLLVIG